MYIFGALFIITSLAILIFIKENDPHENENERLNLINTYKTIWALLKMKPIQSIALILLTVKVSKTKSKQK
jgi:PAT family acetyl-CoA transporter-like MFS transporter 1